MDNTTTVNEVYEKLDNLIMLCEKYKYYFNCSDFNRQHFLLGKVTRSEVHEFLIKHKTGSVYFSSGDVTSAAVRYNLHEGDTYITFDATNSKGDQKKFEDLWNESVFLSNIGLSDRD